MSDRELILRCDCGVEHVDIDLYFTKDVIDLNEAAAVKREVFEEGYLTIQDWRDGCPNWRNRIKSAWDALRGRDHLLQSVILKPQDRERLAEFFSEQP